MPPVLHHRMAALHPQPHSCPCCLAKAFSRQPLNDGGCLSPACSTCRCKLLKLVGLSFLICKMGSNLNGPTRSRGGGAGGGGVLDEICLTWPLLPGVFAVFIEHFHPHCECFGRLNERPTKVKGAAQQGTAWGQGELVPTQVCSTPCISRPFLRSPGVMSG
jgi:hypothetical protein